MAWATPIPGAKGAIKVAVTEAKTANLSPLGDALVDQNNPDTNYGLAAYLQVTNIWPNDNARAFLKFNTSLGASAVQVATLRLYCYVTYHLWYSPNSDVELYKVSDNTWTQLGLTWNTQPALGALILTFTPVINQYDEMNVTAYAQDQLNTTLGLGLKVVKENDTEDTFYSRYYSQAEADYTNRRPLLYMEYTVETSPTWSAVSGARGG